LPTFCISFELLLAGLVLVALGGATAQSPTPAPTQTPAAQTPPPAKPKKVWTNDDVAAAPADPGSAKARTEDTAKKPDPNARLALELRAKLQKLQGMLLETEKQLSDLKNFQSGETSGTARGQVYKGYSSAPIPEQIEKLEARKRQLQEMIDSLYDEARKRDIPPGQLR